MRFVWEILIKNIMKLMIGGVYMHINTTSKVLMEQSICTILNINKDTLYDLLEESYNKFQKDHHVFIIDNQYDYFYDYVKKHLCKSIDSVSLYHLSRRLNDNEDDNGYSLVDVLCNDTSLSRFLKKYGLTFKYDEYIKMYLNGEKIILDQSNDYSTVFLRQVFGYEYQDYCFKGFAFNDAIEKNEYYEILKDGPELFGYLFSFADNDQFIDDFIAHSKYYKFEYQVPIEQIYFEYYDELNDQEKQYHIVVKALQRLYAHKYDSVDLYDDNPVIGIIDDKTLGSQYLVCKQEL